MVEGPLGAPRFSIVISTCDRAASLVTLLDALERQTYRDFEVIVVQGPCQDETSEVLAQRNGQLRRFDCPTRNLSLSRNIGIDAAAGDVVAFIDDDAIPEPRWIEELAREYDDQSVGGAGGLTLDPTGTRPQYRYSICSRIGLTDFDRRPPLDRFNRPRADPFLYLQGTNCSFRREALALVEGFDEEIEYNYDESEVSSRILDAGFELRALDDAVVHHKFLGSAMRGKAGFTDPFLPMKNRAYFALRVGREYATRAAIMSTLTRYLREILDWAEDTHKRGLFSTEEVNHFARRAEEGFALGIERGISGQRKGRTIASPNPDAFLPYPTLRPSDGDRLCVCFVSIDQPPKPAAGIARFTNDLAIGFAREGHEVHMVTRDDEGGYRMDYEAGVWFHRFPVHGRSIPGLESHPVKGLLDHLAAVHSVVEDVAERAPVKVVAGSLWIAEPLLCALNPSWVTTVACNTPTRKIAELQPETASAEITSWQIKLEDALLSSPAHLQPVSKTNAEFISETPGLGPRPLEIIWHGVEDRSREVVRSRDGNDGRIEILFVGRLEPRKGIDTLLEAAVELTRTYPEVSFRIIGADNAHANGREDAWPAWLDARLSSDPPTRDRVTFEGQVDDAGLFQAYADCDIFCAPSRYESFGLVHVEAMMFGRPVIACRAGGMQETVVDGGTGILVEPGDAAELTHALERLIADEELRGQLGQAGRERYEREFRNDVAVQRNVAFYRRLLTGHDPPEPEIAAAETLERTAALLSSMFEMAGVDAGTTARALLDRERFPVDYEHGITTLLGIEDDEEFVAGLYRLLLGREPEPDMRAALFYRDELATGDRMAVVRTIASSQEAQARGVDLDQLLARMAPVRLAAAEVSLAMPPPASGRRVGRTRARQLIRRVRDVLAGVNATRAIVSAHDRRVVEAVNAAPRLVQRELVHEITSTQDALASNLAHQLDAMREQLSRHLDARIDTIAGHQETLRDQFEAVHAQIEVLARKHEALAIDVREKVPDAVPSELPEPLIVDPERFAHQLREPQGVRLNLGCGEKPLPGYINVDMRELPGVDVVADIRRLPFEPGTVREISSAHLVEHFRQHHLESVVLPYWRSLLSAEGVVRIVCPNWAVLIDQFTSGRIGIRELKQVTFGLQDYAGDDHLAMYSPATLTQVLLAAGFADVQVLEERRQNGLAPEMELVARARKAAPAHEVQLPTAGTRIGQG